MPRGGWWTTWTASTASCWAPVPPPDPATPLAGPPLAAKRSLASTLARAATAVAEALLLAAILAAPWPYGSATDTARYALTAVLALAVAVWAVGATLGSRGTPLPTAPV